jgi:membrane protein implicated in regulation of membrane protease activity
MLGTPGHPIITAEWQGLLLLAVGIAVVALIHRYVKRRIARDRSRDIDDRGA